MKRRINALVALAAAMSLALVSCGEKEPDDVIDYPVPVKPVEPAGSVKYGHVNTSFDFKLLEDEKGTTLPDFSDVGYMGSELSIPEAPVVKEISAPADGSDATQLIQNAINEVSGLALKGQFRGAILLRKGTYNVSGTLTIKASGVVLRGEGQSADGTIIVATGVKASADHHRLIKVQSSGSWDKSSPAASDYNLKESYVPSGRMWLTVKNPSAFHKGDDVAIYRPGTDNWIHDLKMDQITAADGVNQWTASGYNFIYERKITHVVGDTLHFDNPIMLSMETQYGGGAVFKAKYSGRISHVGIENMRFRSAFNTSVKTSGYYSDENHTWTAVDFTKTEHSWVTDCTSEFFAYGLVEMRDMSRYITIKGCSCLDGVAVRTGGRLYSFYMDDVDHCLVIDCKARGGRHDCVTGSKGVGPNAFVRVNITSAYADSGPHHRFNVGTLYDNITSNGQINVQDRDEMGSGHGWAGANQYLWNCTGSKVCVQSPWVTAKNYSIGTKGTKYAGHRSNRPDGEWIEQGKDVTPKSLFDAQLALRIKEGRLYHQ